VGYEEKRALGLGDGVLWPWSGGKVDLEPKLPLVERIGRSQGPDARRVGRLDQASDRLGGL
jgi:hypothetical protein